MCCPLSLTRSGGFYRFVSVVFKIFLVKGLSTDGGIANMVKFQFQLLTLA